ncbi:hypothetical protein J5H46_10340 [Enterobacter sichuanensis]|nr:hypothetical protein [Enterobacter sichuanensis]MBO2933873.1 hypothetical protein [Enterobacter sichuanensis]
MNKLESLPAAAIKRWPLLAEFAHQQ